MIDQAAFRLKQLDSVGKVATFNKDTIYRVSLTVSWEKVE